jgi:hypothetical protein
MKQETISDKQFKALMDVNFEHPDIMAQILKNNGYKLKTPITIYEINEASIKAIYNNNKKFISDLNSFISTGEYANWIGIAIGIGSAIFSGVQSSSNAKKEREAQLQIARARIETDIRLKEQEIRASSTLGRMKIIADTIQSHRDTLLLVATEQQKNTYWYLIAMSLGISLIYGTKLLLTPSK